MQKSFYSATLVLIFSFCYAQCDANGDGSLDVIDVVTQVDCILNNCWENNFICEDIDGNIYETVQIGQQLWMAENLKTTRYSNGDEITFIDDPNNWDNNYIGHYAAYNNDLTNVNTYGYLYNWSAANDIRGICPDGFHLPSDEEWSELILHLDPNANPYAENHNDIHSDIAGSALKSTGTIEDNTGLWHDPNSDASNESGFTALPAGLTNDENGNYDFFGYYLGYLAWYWTSTEIDSEFAWTRELFWLGSSIHRHSITKNYGISIRCLKD